MPFPRVCHTVGKVLPSAWQGCAIRMANICQRHGKAFTLAWQNRLFGIRNLTYDNLQTFFDGDLWIITRIKKTNTDSNIRLVSAQTKRVSAFHRSETTRTETGKRIEYITIIRLSNEILHLQLETFLILFIQNKSPSTTAAIIGNIGVTA